MGKGNLKQKKYRTSFLDYYVAILLAGVYAITPGSQYTTGLLQAAWLNDKILTPSIASLINSLTFTLPCIPAPIIQRILDRCGLKPYTIAALALPLLLTGSIWSSYCSDHVSLLISNGILVGIGCSVQLISSWNGLYYIFTDDQIYLFNGFMLAGAGLGIVPISMLFLFVEPEYGWRLTQRLSSLMYLSLLIFAVTLLPPVRKFLGIKTREEKMDGYEQLLSQSEAADERANENEEKFVESSETHEKDNSSSEDEEALEENLIDDNDDVPAIALTSLRSISYQQNEHNDSSSDGSIKPMKYVFSNVAYLLAMISFVFTATAYDTIMVHQPVRMKSFGIDPKAGAFALVINGAIQAVVRVSVGVLTANNIISAARLSQIAKVFFLVSTILSMYITDAYYQTAYYFSLGFGGAVLNTADFFLVKESLKKHRDFAVVMELSAAGFLTFLTMTFVGVLYERMQSYTLAFYLLTGSFVLGLVPSFMYEIEMNRRNRRDDSTRHGYTALN
ncbi:uncharacterized protein LOC142337049 isoform X1 [Convolutriloba macropyga]|uniref:uncharacterized protein LOC142337049 isoform X1 n=1 Tax=Convolutriloba macropyga TaxID=536237 RepID=UPI003F51D837